MRLAISMLLFSALCSTACAWIIPKRVYLIPEGTEGEIYVFRGIVSGEAAEETLTGFIFRVPESRFLLSKFVPTMSPYIPEFYYVKTDGTRIRLEVESSSLHPTEENLNNRNPFVWAPAEVSTSGPKTPCEVKFERFYVGTRPAKLGKTHEDREKEHEYLQKFLAANSERICEGKPPVSNSIRKNPS